MNPASNHAAVQELHWTVDGNFTRWFKVPAILGPRGQATLICCVETRMSLSSAGVSSRAPSQYRTMNGGTTTAVRSNDLTEIQRRYLPDARLHAHKVEAFAIVEY